MVEPSKLMQVQEALKLLDKGEHLKYTDELGNVLNIRKVDNGFEILDSTGTVLRRTDNLDEVTDAVEALYKGTGKIRVDGNKKIFTNTSGNEISWVDQNAKDLDAIINSKLNSSKPGDILEGQVAQAVKETGELKATGLSLERVNGTKVGDVDILTDLYIIEVKKSIGAVDTKQLDKLTNPANPDYFNFDGKNIVYYIEDTTIKNPFNEKTLQALEEAGVTVVNTLDDLKGVISH